MDSLRVLHLSNSSPRLNFHGKRLNFFHALRNPGISFPLRYRSSTIHRIICGVSPTETREGEKKMQKAKSKSGNGKVQLNVRLDHQVEFGEHVVILGSAKELGLWKKKDKSMVWEGGDNRILKLPKRGSYVMVCQWNATLEPMNLLPLNLEENEVEVEDVDENGSVSAATLLEVETSPFVGQWQGKAISFMRSNELRHSETERLWDTSDLEGLALTLVEGDRNARNWWRKVLPFNMPDDFLGFLGIFQ
ncbi:hypothetical protein GH714_024951 [Hevea brasiliensis]|uniref:CBM20 domain-containing protein n=1 Tax=Hevea brasiliensis TaxID=3981 RepID=A0A6A6NIV1_HEVBR|nr:hypothetical protein GH714_024951 [Hevea brasiliensis]